MQNLAQLSDPDFIAESARVRTELAHVPAGTPERAALEQRCAALLTALGRGRSHAHWATAS